jgi:hypothetical protein
MFAKTADSEQKGTSDVKRTQWRPWLPVVTGSESMISTAGGSCSSRLPGSAAWTPVPVHQYAALATLGACHDPAKILLDLTIAVALGGDCPPTSPCLRAQPGVFGAVGLRPDGLPGDRHPRPGRHRCVDRDPRRPSQRPRWVWQRAGAPTQDGWIVLDPTPPC